MPFYLLIFTLIFAPLAYGSTGPAAMALVQAFCWLGLVWISVEVALGKRTFYRPPGLLPLALFGLFMLLQMIPLPPGLLSLISPATAERYSETVWLLQPGAWMPLTVNLQRTLEAFFFFTACLAFYLCLTMKL